MECKNRNTNFRLLVSWLGEFLRSADSRWKVHELHTMELACKQSNDWALHWVECKWTIRAYTGLPKLEGIEMHWKASEGIWIHLNAFESMVNDREATVVYSDWKMLLFDFQIFWTVLWSCSRWCPGTLRVPLKSTTPVFFKGSSLLTGFARAYSGIEIFLLAAFYSDYSIKKETIKPILKESVRDRSSRLKSKHRMVDREHSIELNNRETSTRRLQKIFL